MMDVIEQYVVINLKAIDTKKKEADIIFGIEIKDRKICVLGEVAEMKIPIIFKTEKDAIEIGKMLKLAIDIFVLKNIYLRKWINFNELKKEATKISKEIEVVLNDSRV